MNRNKLTLSIGLALFSVVAAFAKDLKTPARPNFLLLYADDQRNHTLGCAGHPIVKTPNIDRLANQGVRFENAFVTTSTCWVGRASLFTGCYERKHLFKVSSGALNPTLCNSSYFAVLKRAGYRTGHLGKEHVAIPRESASAMWDVRRRIGRSPFFKDQPDGTKRHETQILGDWGINFLSEQPKDKPFCLQISFNATHAEDNDRRPGIGHFPWPKVTEGMYEDENDAASSRSTTRRSTKLSPISSKSRSTGSGTFGAGILPRNTKRTCLPTFV